MVNTYDEMNQKIVELLEMTDQPMNLYAAQRIKNLEAGLLKVAIECNCRAEHGADGGVHLLAIEAMLKQVLHA